MIKTLLVMGLFTALGLAAVFYVFLHTPTPASSPVQKFQYDLVRGAGPSEVSETLEKLGVIKNATLFLYSGRLLRVWGKIRAADYELTEGMTPLQVFKVLQSGIGVHRELLIREGDNLYQVAESMESAGLGAKHELVKLLKSKELIDLFGLSREGLRSFEGYLLPNTYYFEKKDLAVVLIRRMVDAFLKNWTPEFELRAQAIGLSRYQVVTLASVIEKETGASQERPIIASVFHNRLRKKMRLQSDPTTIYGMWERYDGNIRKSDLKTPSDYNTYTVPALPIGPISNPHPLAIKAALYPADSDYLFFVSKNDGTHVFSKTYEEHNEWVNQLQRNRKSREGKSWRDLNPNHDAVSE